MDFSFCGWIGFFYSSDLAVGFLFYFVIANCDFCRNHKWFHALSTFQENSLESNEFSGVKSKTIYTCMHTNNEYTVFRLISLQTYIRDCDLIWYFFLSHPFSSIFAFLSSWYIENFPHMFFPKNDLNYVCWKYEKNKITKYKNGFL